MFLPNTTYNDEFHRKCIKFFIKYKEKGKKCCNQILRTTMNFTDIALKFSIKT